MLSEGRGRRNPLPLAFFLSGLVVLAFIGGWVVARTVWGWVF